MQKFTKIKSKTFVIPQTDIDTDQIIPARFLTTTERTGLGKSAFADWRYDQSGDVIGDAPLNSEAAKTAEVLVAGRNFGCGSSREHAPWSLLDFGFRAVLSSEIADIFRSNSLKNGLLSMVIDKGLHEYLLANPGIDIEIDLENCVINADGYESVAFEIDRFSRYCLLEGVDQLGFLLNHEEDIARFEASR